MKKTVHEPLFQITSKKFNPLKQEYIFTLTTQNNIQFIRFAEELAHDKQLLANMSWEDVYDIAFTWGSLSILREEK